MRAAIFKGAGLPLAIEHRADPEPAGSDDVVVAVHRCGICSSDLHFTDGHAERRYTVDLGLGHEVAGEVVAIGHTVTRVKVGDRVAAMCFSGCGKCVTCLSGRPVHCEKGIRMPTGGYADFMLTTEQALIRLPECLSMADGALIEPLAVALHAVQRCRIQAADRVLVTGAGPIGLGAAFWARKLGAGLIATAEINRNRESLARDMGIDHFLVPNESGRTLAELAKDTLGRLPDVVIECVGAPGMSAQTVKCVRPGGTIGIAGYCMVPDSFVPADGVDKEVTIVFSSVYNLDVFEQVARVLERGAPEPRSMITDTIGLTALPKMFDALRGRTAQVKVQVSPQLG